MQIVPLTATPAQTVAVSLAGQACQLNVYQKRTGLYFDIFLAGDLVLAGVLCLQANLLVRSLYLGFLGDLAFFDVSGADEDPVYSGLGSQWVLVYLSPSEVSNLQAIAVSAALAAEATAAVVTGAYVDFTVDFAPDFE